VFKIIKNIIFKNSEKQHFSYAANCFSIQIRKYVIFF